MKPLSETHTPLELAGYEELYARDWYRIEVAKFREGKPNNMGYQMGRICNVLMYPATWVPRNHSKVPTP